MKITKMITMVRLASGSSRGPATFCISASGSAGGSWMTTGMAAVLICAVVLDWSSLLVSGATGTREICSSRLSKKAMALLTMPLFAAEPSTDWIFLTMFCWYCGMPTASHASCVPMKVAMPLISRTASVTVRITPAMRPTRRRRRNSTTGASAKAIRIDSASGTSMGRPK